MKHTRDDALVLGIHPASRGIGYTVFEGPLRLVDWGVKETRENKNRAGIQKIGELLALYHPSVLVIEAYRGEGSRRAKRIQALLDSVTALARARRVPLRRYSRGHVRAFFSNYDATTKYQIATAIAAWLPELEPRLPPVRKPWMSEDYRMAIFDAASLSLTHFHHSRGEERGAA
ncbi:MAG: hypothetical protein B7X04_01390 [Parcubacteria group bacterium 21-54-25]|nr:MAG: hypothetical protein B7X04_01390 [Parcubacteria group bacterium 21-54-25]HQU07583.1 hypothetical protein [Candidatus Paceibacterota bacterium]